MKHLNSRDLQWCVRCLPKETRNILKAYPNTVFLAGGYIRSKIANEPVNDIDLFVTDATKAMEIGLQLVEGKKHRLHVTNNATTCKGTQPAIQIIHRWTFQTPHECIESFDFTIAAAAIWWNGNAWASECADTYYEDLAARRLIYRSPIREEEAGGSMLRVLKFYQRGYRIPLDSLGAIIARMANAVKQEHCSTEKQWAKVLTALLVEVDPAIDPDHIAHLSTETEVESASEGDTE